MSAFCGLVVPLAGHHAQIVTSDGTEVSDLVVTAVDVGKSLVKRYIEHLELIVVADESLQESLVGESELGKVVVAAVNILEIVAAFHAQGGQIIVGANEVEKHGAVADTEGDHVVVGADE